MPPASSPLHNPESAAGLPDKPFVVGPTQQEALARLHFLVEQGRSTGLLLGPTGSGKSVLLAHFAQQMRRRGSALAIISGAFDGWTALDEVATQWGATPDDRRDEHALWRMAADRLIEHRYEERTSVILLDDADLSNAELATLLLQLWAAAVIGQAPLTIILASRPDRLARIDERLLVLVDLRIELEPWQAKGEEMIVGPAHVDEPGPLPTLDPAAVQRLHELSISMPGMPLARGSS